MQNIKNAIKAAQGKWTGADWTHVYWAPGDTREASDSAVKDCTGTGNHTDCSECADARRDALRAAQLAAFAVIDLDEGRIGSAADCLAEAAQIEATWGDAPTWGPVADLCAAEG